MPRKNFRGCLLGVLCGDVLGAPVEGLTAEQIRQRFGRLTAPVAGPDGVARYTDDTQMTLALARALADAGGRVDPAACADAYAAAFDERRGYGRSATTILRALQAGADWRTTGQRQFPGGSFGNGAAMRIAPVGLLYGEAPTARLRAAVFQAVRATHTHPEAIEGGLLLARLVGRALGAARKGSADLEAVLPELHNLSRVPQLRARLVLIRKLRVTEADDQDAQRLLGSGVRTCESVPLAIHLALRYAAAPLDGLLAAANAGGDTDTIAAMTGAVLGALHGEEIFPRGWLAMVETGPDGVEGLLQSADRLAGLATSMARSLDRSPRTEAGG